MQNWILSVIGIVVVFSCFQVANVEAQEKTCKQILADLTKRQLNGVATCTKSLKLKGGKDKGKKMNCILRCVMVNENVLDEKGYFNAAQMDGLILREFPESLREKANNTFGACVPSASGIDPNPETDEFCKSYDGFIKCMLGNLPGLCA